MSLWMDDAWQNFFSVDGADRFYKFFCLYSSLNLVVGYSKLGSFFMKKENIRINFWELSMICQCTTLLPLLPLILFLLHLPLILLFYLLLPLVILSGFPHMIPNFREQELLPRKKSIEWNRKLNYQKNKHQNLGSLMKPR